jgi:hypothetical protein
VACGFSPDRDIVQQQSGHPDDPRPGDYWLCRVCGQVHVYRITLADQLATHAPTAFELLDAMVALPEMFETRNEILAERGGRQPS